MVTFLIPNHDLFILNLVRHVIAFIDKLIECIRYILHLLHQCLVGLLQLPNFLIFKFYFLFKFLMLTDKDYLSRFLGGNDLSFKQLSLLPHEKLATWVDSTNTDVRINQC